MCYEHAIAVDRHLASRMQKGASGSVLRDCWRQLLLRIILRSLRKNEPYTSYTLRLGYEVIVLLCSLFLIPVYIYLWSSDANHVMWSLVDVSLFLLASSSASLPFAQSYDSNNSGSVADDSYCSRPFKSLSGFVIKPPKFRYRNEEIIIVQCASGKSRSYRCLKSEWNPSVASLDCPSVEGSCPAISFPSYGWFNSSNDSNPFAFGSKLSFHCNAGYEMKGASVIVCQPKFIWSFKPPSCLPTTSTREAGPLNHSLIILISLLVSLIIIAIISVAAFLVHRKHKHEKMQSQWRRYFDGYTYRSSKRHISHRQPQADQQKAVYFTQEAAQITDL